MTSVNVALNQFYDKGNDGTIKGHNLDIRVVVLFFYEYDRLFLQNN